MELAKNINTSEIENKWYKHWLEKNYFHSEPDEREPYHCNSTSQCYWGIAHGPHAQQYHSRCVNKTREYARQKCLLGAWY
jgi:hypothetical protein